MQHGYIAIPKSVKVERMAENLNVRDLTTPLPPSVAHPAAILAAILTVVVTLPPKASHLHDVVHVHVLSSHLVRRGVQFVVRFR